MKETFAHGLHRFSLKDVLTVTFCGAFLFFSYKALKNKVAIEIVQIYVPLIMTILGGYFVSEASELFSRRGKDTQNTGGGEP